MSGRRFTRAGGSFEPLHRALVGEPVDWSALTPEDVPPDLLPRVRAVWQERAQTEFRSIQTMTRFLSEIVGAGDPYDVYAGALDLVEDEIRHTALCVGVCEALGAPAQLPDPVELREPDAFLRAPMPQRALSTAITMLLVNETLSVGFIADLQERCTQPAVRAVLDRTLADEEGHQGWGEAYVRQSLRRFPASSIGDWRGLVQMALAPHRREAEPILARIPPDRRTLDAWPEPELVRFGLFGQERQALVWEQTWRETLAPALLRLDLL